MAFILIVSGEEAVSQRAYDALIGADYACGWVNDIAAARTLMRWQRPDLILLDRDVPGFSVESLLNALEPEHRDVPVIILSKGGNADDGLGKIVHDAQSCIRKPFDPRFLVWRITHALEVHAARSQAGERAVGRARGIGDRRFSIV
jgi:two-component system, OmpR family, phosphate regulon response regulator PhoB